MSSSACGSGAPSASQNCPEQLEFIVLAIGPRTGAPEVRQKLKNYILVYSRPAQGGGAGLLRYGPEPLVLQNKTAPEPLVLHYS